MMQLSQRYKLSKLLGKCRLPYFYPALNVSECRDFERKMVEGVREAVYSSLLNQGFFANEIATEDRGRVMAINMFERCGPCARSLESELTKAIGFKSFKFISVGGHYVVQSEITGLMYDLVTSKGVSCKEELDYAKYLNDKLDGHLPAEELGKKYAIEF